MTFSTMIGLVNNAALLLALGLLYDVMGIHRRGGGPTTQQLLTGLILGAIGMAIMLNPWEFGHGVRFDTRSVLLAISGLFFGTLPTALAMGMTAAFRLAMGGAGVWSGLAVIVTSGGIGLAWRHLRGSDQPEPAAAELYLLGLSVHAVMLLCMLLMPWATARAVLASIGLPVMLIHPVATMALGLLLVNQEKRNSFQGALAESEALYRNLFMNHAAIKLIIDPESARIVEANRAAEAFYGWSVSELETMRVQDINTGPVEQVEEEMGKARSRDRVFFEFRHRRADGSIRDVDVFSSRIEVKGKDLLHSIVHDVTERKLSEQIKEEHEQELQQRNRFIETVLAHLPIGLAVNYIDEGRATYINKRFEEIYGWPGEDLADIDAFFQKVYPDPEYREELKRRVAEDIQSGDPQRMAWEGIEATGKDGEKRVISAKNIPLFEQNLMISTVQDITESRRLQGQLAQAQKMEAVGRLAGGVAHDLNNLLSPILGYGEMLSEDLPPGDPKREPVEEIVSAGYRARDLVRQLLAFSRKQALEFEVLDTNRVMRDFETLLRRTVREDIRIGMTLSADLPPIRADVGQIEQVIMNLAVNAQDAMPDGGRLTIESGVVDLDEAYAEGHRGVTPGRHVMLAVSDTGCGMDDHTISRIFEPFYTTKGPGKGTGLGLATVYGIVKQHGGSVWVYSEPDRGTTFKCYFPAVEEGGPTAEASEAKPPVNLRGVEAVMVVEDDASVRKLAVSILERLGYRVYRAPSGGECLRILREDHHLVRLLITDVVMPDMNGKELYERVVELHPHIRVLYASGYTDNVIAHHGVLDEGIHFIQKPFSVQGLAEKVRAALDERA